MLACRERFNFNIAKRKISKNLFFDRVHVRKIHTKEWKYECTICKDKGMSKSPEDAEKTDGLKEQV